MKTTVWVHNDKTDGVAPLPGTIAMHGEFLHVTCGELHIAVHDEDVLRVFESDTLEMYEGDDGK